MWPSLISEFCISVLHQFPTTLINSVRIYERFFSPYVGYKIYTFYTRAINICRLQLNQSFGWLYFPRIQPGSPHRKEINPHLSLYIFISYKERSGSTQSISFCRLILSGIILQRVGSRAVSRRISRRTRVKEKRIRIYPS